MRSSSESYKFDDLEIVQVNEWTVQSLSRLQSSHTRLNGRIPERSYVAGHTDCSVYTNWDSNSTM